MATLPFIPAANDHRDQTEEVDPGDVVPGYVWLGGNEHWYRLEMPGDRNPAELERAGEPTQ
jgi:hypothetical protein